MTTITTKTVAQWQHEGALLVEDGNHGENRPRKDEFSDRGMAFIRAADMADGTVLFAQAEKIDAVAQRRVRKGIGRPGDVIISHKGTIGRVARAPMDAPNFVCSPQTTFWRVVDSEKIDRDFLFALLRSPGFQGLFATRAGETDMAGYVSLTSQRELELSLPPIAIQREVGRTVRLIDDKIELNRKTAATLEEMARALYRSWFVDFDPVQAKAEGCAPAHMDPATAALFPDSFGDDGLPKGWKIRTVGELCVQTKRTVKPMDAPASSFWHFSLPAFDSGRVPLLEDGAQIKSNKLFVPNDAILFSRLNPMIPRVWWARSDHGRGVPAASTEFFVANAATPEQTPWLYSLLSSEEFREQAVSRVTGTSNSHQRLSASALAEIAVTAPPDELLAAFGTIAGSWFERVHALGSESGILANLRDTLLPRLMSGELRVGEALEQIDEVA
ncbi:restriction endonuclease subunit S [Frigidibacter sp. MR17.24]|uniref:restriction endonuclease subunit S n=1 Tax=Frigidibacter sp. MR17.24 TaxID=3127345 RepID=UPI003012DF3A